MSDSRDKFIVLGEAPESDDDDYVMPSVGERKIGDVVVGEGDEQEDSDEFQITAEELADQSRKRVRSVQSQVAYNTVLHQRLRESNKKAEDNMKHFVKQTIGLQTSRLNDINQKLLLSQIQVQESSLAMKKGLVSLAKLNIGLHKSLGQPFLPNLKKPVFIPPIRSD